MKTIELTKAIQLSKELITELEKQLSNTKSEDELTFITRAKNEAFKTLCTLKYINQ